jgi:dTDP-4-dehydrorhamnose reductase
MRILITGAGGMLGTDARQFFESHGHEIIPADSNPETGDNVRLDITNFEAVRVFFAKSKPDLVLHTAAYTDVDGCERDPNLAYRVNALGTWAVASAAQEIGAILVAISTDFVFDGTKSVPYTEFDTPNPLSHYGASKLAGEKMARQHCAKAYVVRTSWLYGEHGKKNFPYTIANRAKTQSDLYVVADQRGTPTYTKDLVRAIAQIIEKPLYGTYHISNSGNASWSEFAEAVLSKAGISGVTVHPISSEECAVRFNTPTARPKYSVLRHFALELRNGDMMRQWGDALDEFIAAAKLIGKI